MKRRLAIVALVLAVLPACTVGAGGGVTVQGSARVVYTQPPQPQVETTPERRGFLWVKGHWVWANDQWTWEGGRWERERSGFGWQDGHWERRGNAWHWIEGHWAQGQVTVETRDPEPVRDHRDPQPEVRDHRDPTPEPAGDYPSSDPPPPQAETQGAQQKGFIWAAGRWDWRAGKWVWVSGHWERSRPNKTWEAGHWEKRGNRWVWTEGGWR